MSASQGVMSGPQVFRASFGIPSGPGAVLFERRLMVLAISSVVMSLSTLRRVAGVSPVISLRSAGAGWGKNLSVRIFAFLLLSLVVGDSPVLRMGGRCGSSTGRPAFFFAHFAIVQRP